MGLFTPGCCDSPRDCKYPSTGQHQRKQNKPSRVRVVDGIFWLSPQEDEASGRKPVCCGLNSFVSFLLIKRQADKGFKTLLLHVCQPLDCLRLSKLVENAGTVKPTLPDGHNSEQEKLDDALTFLLQAQSQTGPGNDSQARGAQTADNPALPTQPKNRDNKTSDKDEYQRCR